MENKDYSKIISANLKRIAFDRDKTQADIARDLKINKGTISSWMNGTRIPRISKIDMLCKYFDVSRSEIMEEYDPNNPYNTPGKIEYLAYKMVNDTDLRELYEIKKTVGEEKFKKLISIVKNMMEL